MLRRDKYVAWKFDFESSIKQVAYSNDVYGRQVTRLSSAQQSVSVVVAGVSCRGVASFE